MTNMKMWPQYNNPSIAPVIKSMLGRPQKTKRKEANETRKSGKLPRTGMQMTCSSCGGKNHNKRSCHKDGTKTVGTSNGGISTTASQTTAAARSSNAARPRGRPRKAPVVPETPPRSRGRPRKETSAPKAPPRPRGRPRKEPTVVASPRPRKEPELLLLLLLMLLLEQEKGQVVLPLLLYQEEKLLTLIKDLRQMV
ncbi:hypothetical protein RND71_021350 [Anisodus tanguticus]|uniref:Uncharacterized protein n=1 Tax=Anisodus tanguticus TaxID=243964 RepID=A0AAE1RY76_9SOLA|nr:hypothetical protein RND71_021350 [Anisodus tanguticus]